jgi:hypothetical protein
MPNRADYTNALVQAVAQQELARRQSRAANTTNRLVDQIALPDASQPFTRPGPPPPMPGVGDFQLPQQLEPLNELGRTMDPDVLPVEALTPEPEPAGIAQWVTEAMGDLFSRKQTDRGAKIETIMRLTGAEDETIFMGMTDEELDRAIINIRSDFEQGGYQHIPARRAE